MSTVPVLAPPPEGTIIVFSTPWCGYCRGLKAGLNRAGIEYTEVDIEQYRDGADYVMSINGGNQTVPTVLFADGTTATNPSVAEVALRVA